MRYIRIFVSSTFSDMHRERDLLHQIAGLINRDIFGLGYQVVLKDLRYGIDTAQLEDEEEIERKILSECFGAIDECELFVLLIGQRYGSVFDDISTPGRYMPHRDLAGKSVTHLEVEYGTLQLDKERIMVFERQVEEGSHSLPPRYCDTEEGTLRNRMLREWLGQEGYNISPYAAFMKDDEFSIDEYTFIKHGQGFIQQMVMEIIKSLPEGTTEEDEVYCPEVLNRAVMEQIDEKLACYDDNCRDTARELILLRIQDLLSRDDYDEINRLGGDGKVIQEYRKGLIADLPNDFTQLLREICRQASAVSGCDADLYGLLEVLACAQKTELAQMGGISLYGIKMIMEGQREPSSLTLNEWLTHRQELGGTYREQTPVQRALACFLGRDVLISHSEEGYLLGGGVEKIITSSEDIKQAALCYMTDVLRYLPRPALGFLELLAEKRYDLCLEAFKSVCLDNRFSDELVEAAEDVEKILLQLEDMIEWLIESEVEPLYIRYAFSLCSLMVNGLEDERSDEVFYQTLVPLYERVYQRLSAVWGQSLTLSRRYLLLWLYEKLETELSDPAPRVLTEEQTEEARTLTSAVWELFCSGDPQDPAHMAAYLEAISQINNYIQEWDEVISIIQAEAVEHNSHLSCLFGNFLYQAFLCDEKGWDRLEKILNTALLVHPAQDDLMPVINELSYKLLNTAYRCGDNELCIRTVEFIYGIACNEAGLRRSDWYSWSESVSDDIVNELWGISRSEAIRELVEIKDNLLFADLQAIDRSLLEEKEEFYSKFKNS